MRRFTLVLLTGLLLCLVGVTAARADDGKTDSTSFFPVVEIFGQNTCFDVSRYDGYIRGSYLGGAVSRSTIKIQRARDGWYWDGWRFVQYPVEHPLTLGLAWEFPFRADYGLYFITVEMVTAQGYRLEAHGRLALQVKTQEFVYQSTRNGNTDIFRAENRAFAVGEVRLTENAADDGAPVFSPDHQFIAFETNRDGNFEIYVMDSAYGRTLYRVTNHAADDRAPSWSPDGKSLVFHSNRDGNYEIYATSFPYGKDLYRLTNHAGEDKYPSWSPDGKYIAFQSNREQGKPQIYQTTYPYGASTYRLGRFSGANDTTPSFSPDGLFIAFSSTRAGNGDIFIIDSDYGNTVYPVTRTAAADTNPVWTPYCNALYYQSESAGGTAIFQAYNPFYGRDNRRVTLDPISNLLRGLGIP
jgi:dipeptidyl aminopeptidase/acylaminoacyl peptidase